MNKKTKRRRPGRTIFFLLIVLLAVFVYDGNTRIVTDVYELAFDNLPDAFDGYRIVHLSDIHAAQFGQDNARLLAAVEKARGDIIVITGDMIDFEDDVAAMEPLAAQLAAIAPVYYVTGNHEWASGGLRDFLRMLGEQGVTVLQNAYETIEIGGQSIVLAGIDDPNGPRDMITPEDFISALRKKEGDPFIVLLAHRNNYLTRASKMGLDLVLCGHAHGGLIRVPFVGGLIGPGGEMRPEYTDGVYARGRTRMVVSRGLGNRLPVPRLFNNPHIPVIILKTS